MQALLLDGPAPAASGPLRLARVADPVPGAGELLIRVGACAVCRTDLQLAEGDIAAHRSPLVLGHQAVGRVAAIGDPGPAATDRSIDTTADWAVGDRAAVTWLAGSCGTCRACRSGRENLCREAIFTGWDRDGGFAELMTVRADVAVPVPDAFPDVAAAPLLCGGVIGYRALRVSGIEPGGRLGLFGFGASARLAIQVARSWGCEIYAWARDPRDRARALALGAAWAGGHGEPGPVPLDAAVTFAPVGSVVVEALRSLDRGGVVAINAIHLDGIPAFPYEDLWWERSIRSVANVTRRDATEFLALAATIGIETEPEPMPLADGDRALLAIARGEIAGAAVLVPG